MVIELKYGDLKNRNLFRFWGYEIPERNLCRIFLIQLYEKFFRKFRMEGENLFCLKNVDYQEASPGHFKTR
jgi:hypothetical protein